MLTTGLDEKIGDQSSSYVSTCLLSCRFSWKDCARFSSVISCTSDLPVGERNLPALRENFRIHELKSRSFTRTKRVGSILEWFIPSTISCYWWLSDPYTRPDDLSNSLSLVWKAEWEKRSSRRSFPERQVKSTAFSAQIRRSTARQNLYT